MKTDVIKIDPARPEPKRIASAAKTIKRGGLVAFPTETVYGLGADATNESAIKRIYAAKGRPSDNPMIVHIANKSDLHKLCTVIPPKALKLSGRFWPGPLTIILKKSKLIPDAATGGLDTVAIRMPSHNIALELIKKSGVPIAAPSANTSGKPSATSAGHVIDDLYGKVDVIIDGGNVEVGLESTVIDMTSKTPTILRPGKITPEQLRKAIGNVAVHKSVTSTKPQEGVPRSPGIKYKHYAPHSELVLVTGTNRVQKIAKIAEEYAARKQKVAIIATRNAGYEADLIETFSSPSKYAKNLFHAMREFDKKGANVIIAEAISEKKLGLAVMNRLKKAATRIVKA